MGPNWRNNAPVRGQRVHFRKINHDNRHDFLESWFCGGLVATLGPPAVKKEAQKKYLLGWQKGVQKRCQHLFPHVCQMCGGYALAWDIFLDCCSFFIQILDPWKVKECIWDSNKGVKRCPSRLTPFRLSLSALAFLVVNLDRYCFAVTTAAAQTWIGPTGGGFKKNRESTCHNKKGSRLCLFKKKRLDSFT